MGGYEYLLIKNFDHWFVQLHEKQCYLGRLIIAAKREDDVDFFEMSPDEREEFFDLGRKVKKALSDLFQPDRLNYANLQNIWNHLHVHVIPRYASSRTFDGIVFQDQRWGKNYAPYDSEFKVPESTQFKIRDSLKERL